MRKLNVDRLKRIAKENLLITCGMVVVVSCSLILVRVLTEYLTPTQYGELSLALTLVNLINQIVMCGLISGIGRFYSIAAEKKALTIYIRDAHKLLFYATLLVILIGLLCCAGLMFMSQSTWITLAIISIVFAILTSYNSVYSDIQNAARHRGIVNFSNGLDSILKIVLSIGAFYLINKSSTSVMIGYCASACIVLITNKFLLRYAIPIEKHPHLHAAQSKTWARQIWAYAWPFSTWGIFTWAQQASDRWALQIFSTTDDVGVYSVLFQLGYVPIMMLSGLASGFLTPIFFQRAGDASDAARNQNVHRVNWLISWALLALTIIAALLAAILHPWVFKIFVSASYREHSYLLPWFVLAGGFFATGQMFALKLMSEVRSKHLLPVKISTALLGCALNIFGAWIAGLTGIVIALVCFSSSYVIWTAWLARSSIAAPLITKDAI